jgi:hypothetical protein
MKKLISSILLVVSLPILFQVDTVSGACNPKCEQGQTCRFEQPNTYYCQNINGVQGSQQSSMGAANSNAMQSRSVFDSRDNSGYGVKQGSNASIASGRCSGVASACVSVTISGYETIYASLEEAMLALLRQSLTEGRAVSAELNPNEYALSDFVNGNRSLGPIWDMIMSHQFMDLPDDRLLQDISSMIPPVSDRMRNLGLDQIIAQIEAQFGYQAMQAMMQELKDIAIASGGSVEPTSTALVIYGLAIAAAPFVYQVGMDIYESWNPDPYSEAGDPDGDGLPNGQDPDDDNDGIMDWDELEGQGKSNCKASGTCEEELAEINRRKGEPDDKDTPDNSGIIYETEGRMIQVQVYERFRSYQQMYIGTQNPFYFR